jgi:hypothetical protein
VAGAVVSVAVPELSTSGTQWPLFGHYRIEEWSRTLSVHTCVISGQQPAAAAGQVYICGVLLFYSCSMHE